MYDVNKILTKNRFNHVAEQKSNLPIPMHANSPKRQNTTPTLAYSPISPPTISAKLTTLYDNYKSTDMEKPLDKIFKLFSLDLNEDHLKNLPAKMFALKSTYDMLSQGESNPSLTSSSER